MIKRLIPRSFLSERKNIFSSFCTLLFLLPMITQLMAAEVSSSINDIDHETSTLHEREHTFKHMEKPSSTISHAQTSYSLNDDNNNKKFETNTVETASVAFGENNGPFYTSQTASSDITTYSMTFFDRESRISKSQVGDVDFKTYTATNNEDNGFGSFTSHDRSFFETTKLSESRETHSLDDVNSSDDESSTSMDNFFGFSIDDESSTSMDNFFVFFNSHSLDDEDLKTATYDYFPETTRLDSQSLDSRSSSFDEAYTEGLTDGLTYSFDFFSTPTNSLTDPPTPTPPVCTPDCNGNCSGPKFPETYDKCGVCGGNGSKGCLVFTGIEPQVLPVSSTRNVKVTIIGNGFLPATDITVTIGGVEVDQSELEFVDETLIVWSVKNWEKYFSKVGTVNVVVKKVRNEPVNMVSLSFFSPPDNNGDFGKYNRESGELVISNIFSFPGFKATCLFSLDKEEPFSVPAKLVSNKYSCTAPKTASGDLYYNILYALPTFSTPEFPDTKVLYRSNYMAFDDYSYAIKVFEDAPILVSARFSSTGAILVSFDKPVKIIQSKAYIDSDFDNLVAVTLDPIPCSTVFESSPGLGMLQSLIGSKYCDLTVLLNVITIQIDSKFAFDTPGVIKPEEKISLMKNTVAADFVKYSFTAQSTSLVSYPTVIPLPVLYIEAPTRISACVDFVIDVSGVYGSAGRKWESVKITFTSTSVSPNDAKLTAEFQRQADLVAKSGKTEIVIAKELMAAKKYRITLTFVNFLSGESSTVVEVEKIDSTDIPLVSMPTTINGIDVSVFNFVGTTITPSCGRTENVKFSWSLLPGSPSVFIPNPSLSTLTLGPLSLQPAASYRFQVNVGYNGKNSAGNDFPMFPFFTTLNTLPDKIVANAGPSQIVSTAGEFVIKSVIVNSAYKSPLDTGIFVCDWSCRDIKTAKPCVSLLTGKPLLISTCEANLSKQLGVGSYKFDIKVKNSDTNSESIGDPSFVTVKDTMVPVLMITPTDLNPSSRSLKFKLKSFIDEKTVKDVNEVDYLWTSEKKCNGVNFISIPLTLGVTTKTPPTLKDLVFIPGALTASASYCFKLTATDRATKETGYSSLTIRTSSSPSGGFCSIEGPTIGMPFETNFVFKCLQWSTDELSYPIQYLFYVAPENAAYVDPSLPGSPWSLVASGSSSKFSRSFPVGKFQLLAVIRDNAGSTNLVPQIASITITESGVAKRSLFKRASLAKSISMIKAQNDNFLLTQDWKGALGTIQTGLLALPKSYQNWNEESSTLQQNIIALLGSVVDSGNFYLDPANNAAYLANILKASASNNYNLTKDSYESLYSLTQKSITNSNKIAKEYDSCYSNVGADDFFTTLDIILQSLVNQKGTTSEVTKNLIYTLDSINKCRAYTQSCGETITAFDGSSIKYNSGVDKTSGTALTACSMSVSVKNNTCYHYSCYTTLANGILPSDFAVSNKYVAVGNKLTTLSLSDFSSKDVVLSANVKGSVLEDPSLINQYSLEDTKNGRYFVKFGEISFGSNPPTLTTTGSVKNDSSLNSINSFGFSSTNTGTFVMLIDIAPVVSVTPTPTPETSGVNGIVIGAIGGSLAVLIIAGAVFGIKRAKKKRESKGPVDNLDPIPQVAIQIDAPPTQEKQPTRIDIDKHVDPVKIEIQIEQPRINEPIVEEQKIEEPKAVAIAIEEEPVVEREEGIPTDMPAADTEEAVVPAEEKEWEPTRDLSLIGGYEKVTPYTIHRNGQEPYILKPRVSGVERTSLNSIRDTISQPTHMNAARQSIQPRESQSGLQNDQLNLMDEIEKVKRLADELMSEGLKEGDNSQNENSSSSVE